MNKWILFIFFLLCFKNTQALELDSLTAGKRHVSQTTSIELSKHYTRVSKKKFPLSISFSAGQNILDSLQVQLYSFNEDNEATDTLLAISDSTGVVHFLLGPFSNPGEFNFLIYTNPILPQLSTNKFTIGVKEKDWVFKLIVGLFGGLSLFLFGMSLMSNGLQNAAGNNLRRILEKLTDNRFLAVGIGAFITTIIQSSSATNVMLVSFVNSQLMKFKQTIGIILGAAIGTTITAQIIAFKITDYALVFITLGAFMYFLAKKEKISQTAKAVLGFGILFYGMHIMSVAMYPLRNHQPFIDTIISLENPLFGILIGTIFTALIQSSSAFIGILIVLSIQGLLSLNASISLIIGANIGTAITAILASINASREAKQVALAHTLIKIVGAGLILAVLPYFTNIISSSNQNSIATPRQIANAHTLYNIILFIIFIPFTNSVARLINKLYSPQKEIVDKPQLKFIDPSLLFAPEIALNAARKELICMMRNVEEMFTEIINVFIDKSVDGLNSIYEKEEEVNHWRDELSDFLVHLSRSERSKDQIEETFIILNAVKEFEQIADVISTQLAMKAESWCSSTYDFSKKGKKELLDYHQMTLNIIQKAIKVYKGFDVKKAQKLKLKYSEYREEYFSLEKLHYDRLTKNVESTLTSSKTHLELITSFKVISSHATNTARTIIYGKQKSKKNKK